MISESWAFESSDRGPMGRLDSCIGQHIDPTARQVGEVGQDFVGAATCADLADYHANRDAHSADARLATHDLGLLGDAIELTHVAAPYRNSLHGIGSRK